MDEVTNEERAEAARKTLNYFGEVVPMGDDEIETLAGDLLCNIFHLCDELDIDHDRVIDMATYHYESEVAKEDT